VKIYLTFKNNLANLFFCLYYYSEESKYKMDNKEIYKVLIVSIKEFGSEVEVIRQICQKYEVAEIFDDKNNVA
jgi:hypothetical protein